MNVLALVAHPDDEVIGCGGTLARHGARGDKVWLITMADGVSSRNASDQGEAAHAERGRAMAHSCDILGISLLRQFNFQDNQLDQYPLLDLVRAVEACISGMTFDRVYTHSRTDLNVDHRVVHDLALTVFRPLPNRPLTAVLAFETLSATHWFGPDQPFSPQYFIDISSYWDQKVLALNAYPMEMRPFPHARSLEAVRALAGFRGAACGRALAEAFELVRMVEP